MLRAQGLYGPSSRSGVSRCVRGVLAIRSVQSSRWPSPSRTSSRVPGHAAAAARRRGASAGRPIRWVHVSELEDPTPWLKGGELIAHHGHGHRHDAGEAARLREAPGRARAWPGWGSGSGSATTRRRSSLVDRRRAGGLPAVRGALPGAVHRDHRGRVHAHRRRAVRHAAAGRRRRARADAGRDGGRRASRASRASLADVTKGWALLLDLHGLPIAAHRARGHAARRARLGGAARLAARGHRVQR